MVKIYTLADKRPDFIEMQYASMKKNIIGEFEYIVINNCIDSKERATEINQICEKLNIKHEPVELLPELNNGSYSNGVYKTANTACLYPLTWLMQKKIEDVKLFCFIDSDMFFIDKFDIYSIFDKHDFTFMPQYRGDFKYVSPAIFFLNKNKVLNYKTLDWNFYNSKFGITDVGGCTNDFLNKNPDVNNGYIEQYSIYTISYYGNIKNIHIILNGNINYEILENRKNNTLISVKQTGGNKAESEGRSFEYQDLSENYSEKIYLEYLKIKNKIKNNMSQNPIHTGFMKMMDDERFCILHYQTGSNYADFSTKEYNDKKTESIKKIISND
jgi:hypothetical protein